MRWPLVLLAVIGCVDAGVNLQLPTESFELAFILEQDGENLFVSHGPMTLVDGRLDGKVPPAASIRSESTLVLIGFNREDLGLVSPFLDLDRLLEAQLLIGPGDVCDERFDLQEALVEGALLDTQPTFLLSADAPARPHPARAQLLPRLRLQSPTADRPCRPPLVARPYGLEGHAIEDGFEFQEDSYPYAPMGNAEIYLRFEDAQYLPSGGVVGATPVGLLLLERGDRIAADSDPRFVPATSELFRWPDGRFSSVILSMAVLAHVSTSHRSVVLVALLPDVFDGQEKVLLVSLEHEAGELRVLTSTVVPGVVDRAAIDSSGRALIPVTLDKESEIVWTDDGLQFTHAPLLLGEIKRVLTTPDPARPHLVLTRKPQRLYLGDATRPELGWEEPELAPSVVPEDVRSATGYMESGELVLALGSEDRRILILHPGQAGAVIRPRLDAFTARTACAGAPDACGVLDSPREVDEIAVVDVPGHSKAFLYLGHSCPEVLSVRENGCATHVPPEVTLPLIAGRSLRSLRFSPEGDRALVAGAEGRLFELVIDP